MSRVAYQHSYYLRTKKTQQKKSKDYYIEHKDEILAASQQRYQLNVAAHLLKNAERRAKEKDLPFDLELLDIVIPTHCPILGIKLRVGNGRPGGFDNSPSLDRIVPELGYVIDNVEVISYRANRLKSDATSEELTKIAKYMKRKRDKSNPSPSFK